MDCKRMLIPVFSLLALLLLSITPALAQDTPWFVYLYNGRDLLRVYQDGTTESFNVGLAEGVFVGGLEMAFSDDGSRAAFCATSYPPAVEGQASEPPSTRLYLRDIVGQTNLFDVDLGTAIGCRIGPEGMSPDGSRIAVGVLNSMPGDPQANADKPAWQLLVLDAATGSIVHELNADSPEAVNIFGQASGPTMPYVQSVENNSVIFALMPWFTEGFIEAAYRWNLDSGVIEPAEGEQWEQFRLDTLEATGEQVWIAADPTLPANQPMGPMPSYNVVRVVDGGGQVSTIYHNAEENPIEAEFINDGQQVAVLLNPPFDESNPGAPLQYHWVAVDRAGSVTDLSTDAVFSYLRGAPGGYVRLVWDSPDQDPNNATYRLFYTADGQTTELWSMAGSADQFGSWELAWAAPMPASESLPPFTNINP